MKEVDWFICKDDNKTTVPASNAGPRLFCMVTEGDMRGLLVLYEAEHDVYWLLKDIDNPNGHYVGYEGPNSIQKLVPASLTHIRENGMKDRVSGIYREIFSDDGKLLSEEIIRVPATS